MERGTNSFPQVSFLVPMPHDFPVILTSSMNRFSGTKAAVKDNIAGVQKITKLYNSSKFEFAKSEEEKEQLWSARKDALRCMLALRTEGQEVWSTDVAVPLSRLADLIGM